MYIARAKGQRLKAALEGIGTDTATLGQRWTTRGVITALGLPHRRLSRGGGPSVPHYAESPIVARRLVKRTEVGTRDQLACERWCVDAAIRERDAERSATLTTAALHRRLLALPIEAAGGPLVRCMLAHRGAAQNSLRITTLLHSQSLLLTHKRPQRASRVTEPGEPQAGCCSTAARDDTALDYHGQLKIGRKGEQQGIGGAWSHGRIRHRRPGQRWGADAKLLEQPLFTLPHLHRFEHPLSTRIVNSSVAQGAGRRAQGAGRRRAAALEPTRRPPRSTRACVARGRHRRPPWHLPRRAVPRGAAPSPPSACRRSAAPRPPQ